MSKRPRLHDQEPPMSTRRGSVRLETLPPDVLAEIQGFGDFDPKQQRTSKQWGLLSAKYCQRETRDGAKCVHRGQLASSCVAYCKSAGPCAVWMTRLLHDMARVARVSHLGGGDDRAVYKAEVELVWGLWEVPALTLEGDAWEMLGTHDLLAAVGVTPRDNVDAYDLVVPLSPAVAVSVRNETLGGGLAKRRRWTMDTANAARLLCHLVRLCLPEYLVPAFLFRHVGSSRIAYEIKSDAELWDAQGAPIVLGGTDHAWRWYGIDTDTAAIEGEIALWTGRASRCATVTERGRLCRQGNKVHPGCDDYCTSPVGCPKWTRHLLKALLRALQMRASLPVSARDEVAIAPEQLRLSLLDRDKRELFSMSTTAERWNLEAAPEMDMLFDADAGWTEPEVAVRHLCRAMHRPQVRTMRVEFRYVTLDHPRAKKQQVPTDVMHFPRITFFDHPGMGHRQERLQADFDWELTPQVLATTIRVR